MPPIIAVSGGFDIFHNGHADYLLAAGAYGDVVVLLNSDAWLLRKKKYVFMNYAARRKVMSSIKGVIDVMPGDDSLTEDNSVSHGLRELKKKYPDQVLYFAKGGDRHQGNVPEQELCNWLGIDMIWGVGGTDKSESSSELVRRVQKRPTPCVYEDKV